MATILLSILSLALFSLRLTSFPLKNWDEAWYAEIIKNLATRPLSFLVPFWNGQYYFDKPPLYFWLSYPLVKLFGLGEWQVRLVSVIAGTLAVVLVYKIATLFFSRRIGFFAGIIFLSLGQVILRFQEGTLDSLLICLFLAAIYFFISAKGRHSFILLAGVSLGLSYLVKSWLYGFFPLLFMAAYVLFVKKEFLRPLISIFLTSIFVSSWWYLLGYLKFGQTFLSWYLFNPTANNYSSLPQFSWVYVRSFVLDLGLWFLPLIYLIKRPPHFSLSQADQKKILVFLIPSLIYFIFVNLSADKFSWYLLPLYPFLAITLALFFSLILAAGRPSLRFLITAVFIGQLILIYNFHRLDPDRSLVGTSLGLAVHKLVPSTDLLILDDQDFPAFLYYSNLNKVYVVKPGGGKPGEFWILDYHEVNNLVSSNPRIWLVTNEPEKFSSLKISSTQPLPDHYQLLQLDGVNFNR